MSGIKNHESEQNRRLGEIEKHIEIINKEIGCVKVEMANMRTDFTKEFGEISKKVVELKVARKETYYAIIVPILTAILAGLAVFNLTQ